jgi:hypothetical protein
LAIFSPFLWEEQDFQQSLPQFAPLQRAAAVLSPAVCLQDIASLLQQPDASFASAEDEELAWCAQQVWPSFISAAILSQHGHALTSAGAVLCCGVEGVGWVVFLAHETAVRTKVRAISLCLINSKSPLGILL